MKITTDCQINAPVAEVFEMFSDLQQLEEHVQAITRIELLTSGPVGVGTKFKETRVMFGKESSEVMEISRFSPPEHLREEAHSHGMHYVSDWTFQEENGLTTVTITFRGQAQTLTAKLMGLMFSFMAGSMKKAFQNDMNDLKTKLEQPHSKDNLT